MAYLTLLDKLLLYNLLFLCLIVIEVVVSVSFADPAYCFTGEGLSRTRLDFAFSTAIAGTWVRKTEAQETGAGGFSFDGLIWWFGGPMRSWFSVCCGPGV